jgi:hypothetical protein
VVAEKLAGSAKKTMAILLCPVKFSRIECYWPSVLADDSPKLLVGGISIDIEGFRKIRIF